MDTNKLSVVEFLDIYEVSCGDEDVVTGLDEGVLALLYKNNKDGFHVDFFHTLLLYSFLGKPWVVNVDPTMVICR